MQKVEAVDSVEQRRIAAAVLLLTPVLVCGLWAALAVALNPSV